MGGGPCARPSGRAPPPAVNASRRSGLQGLVDRARPFPSGRSTAVLRAGECQAQPPSAVPDSAQRSTPTLVPSDAEQSSDFDQPAVALRPACGCSPEARPARAPAPVAQSASEPGAQYHE